MNAELSAMLKIPNLTNLQKVTKEISGRVHFNVSD
jgi:hypothetical protein